jgi:hypothetical protein
MADLSMAYDTSYNEGFPTTSHTSPTSKTRKGEVSLKSTKLIRPESFEREMNTLGQETHLQPQFPYGYDEVKSRESVQAPQLKMPVVHREIVHREMPVVHREMPVVHQDLIRQEMPMVRQDLIRQEMPVVRQDLIRQEMPMIRQDMPIVRQEIVHPKMPLDSIELNCQTNVVNVLLLVLVIIMALAFHSFIERVFSNYIISVDWTLDKEMFMRILYPAIIVFALYFAK